MFWFFRRKPVHPTATFTYRVADGNIGVSVRWPRAATEDEKIEQGRHLAALLYHVLSGNLSETVMNTLPLDGEAQGDPATAKLAALLLAKALDGNKPPPGDKLVVDAADVFKEIA